MTEDKEVLDHIKRTDIKPRRHSEANTALFLGIASIVFSLGALGLALAIFGMIAGTRTLTAYNKDKSIYTRNSYTRALAGVISSASAMIIFISVVGFLSFTMFG